MIALDNRGHGESSKLYDPAQYSIPAMADDAVALVVEDSNGELQGLEAVIDKDLASSLLARDLQAELFVISTGVEKVALNFNQPNEKWLDRVTLSELRRYVAEGHFAKGSMAPKIDAVISFLDGAPGGRAIITNPPNLGRALSGAAGTHVVGDG